MTNKITNSLIYDKTINANQVWQTATNANHLIKISGIEPWGKYKVFYLEK